jgi:plastocyanin
MTRARTNQIGGGPERGRNRARRVALALAAVLLAAPISAAVAAEAGPRIEIREHRFSAALVTVPPGTTVTWVNHDDDVHTVTSTVDLFRSPGLDSDETYAYTFTRPGTYEYYCTLHPLMTGKVIVRSGS